MRARSTARGAIARGRRTRGGRRRDGSKPNPVHVFSNYPTPRRHRGRADARATATRHTATVDAREDGAIMADEDLAAIERMVAMMELKERELVREKVHANFASLRIAWTPGAIENGATSAVYASNAGVHVDGGSMKEFAGHAFHERAREKLGLSAVCEKKLAKAASLAALDEAAMDDDVDFNSPEYKMKKTKRRGNKEFGDHYGALGLALKRFNATKEEILERHWFLTVALHPDKRGVAQVSAAEAEKIEQRYKAVVTAMEVLTDKNRRREFDSVDAPEYNFPTECEDGDFFATFMPSFHLLARFSETKPVPICDDPDAEWDEVRKHYIFWAAKFSSWREFPHEKENDTETAHDRDHRRQMEKENKRLRAESKKKEQQEIRRFVENAQKYDPRVIKQKAAEKAARDAKKLGRTDSARALAEEDAKKKAEEEAAAKVAEEANKAKKADAKKELEKAKKALRKDKQRVRAIGVVAEGWVDYPGDAELESICDALTVDHADAVKAACDAAMNGDEVKGAWDAVACILSLAVTAKGGDWQAKADEHASRRAEREASEKVGGAWNADETAELEKASKQLFPLGTINRWDSVAAHMAAEGKPRTAMDCMVKARSM